MENQVNHSGYLFVVVYCMTLEEILDIVDEQDNVIWKATRDEIHRKGMLHRVVGVLLVRENGKIVLQHRAWAKGWRLDTTASWHVPTDKTYEEAAVQEVYEETGVLIDTVNLRYIGVQHMPSKEVDNLGKIENVIVALYLAHYNEVLVAEEWTIESFLEVTFEELEVLLRVVPFYCSTILHLLQDSDIKDKVHFSLYWR